MTCLKWRKNEEQRHSVDNVETAIKNKKEQAVNGLRNTEDVLIPWFCVNSLDNKQVRDMQISAE